jgi:ribosome-binding protein aMBF1 (putative translation factor)
MNLQCRKCGKLKEAFLFTPGEIKKKHLSVCRECVRAKNRAVNYRQSKAAAEVSKLSARPLLAYEAHFNRNSYMNKIAKNVEIKVLVEAREKRLEREGKNDAL